MTNPRPLFKDMTPQELRDAYASARASVASWDSLAKLAPYAGRGTRAKVAGGVFRALRDIDIIVAVARKRGIKLTGAED